MRVLLLYASGWLLSVLSAVMLVPVLFAFALQEIQVAQIFFVVALVVGFVGIGLLLALKDQKMEFGRKQGLLLVCAIWVFVPFVAAIPFILAGIPDTVSAAYFEAVSGFTTTGATVLIDLAEVPKSLLVWRSLLQWLGGLSTLMALSVVLNPLMGADVGDRDYRQVHRSTHATIDHAKTSFRTIFPIYSGLSLLCFVLLIFSEIPPFDAFCLSLSTLSTGGFMPRAGTLELYGSPPGELVIAIFMFLGGVSVIWLNSILRFRWNAVREIPEPLWIAGAIVLFGTVMAALLLSNSPETGIRLVYRSWTLGLATAASFVSTTGYTVSERTQDFLPYMFVIMVCLVGGGRFSTAGGLKFFRVAAMIRQSMRELRQLVFPHGVRPSRFGREARDNEIIRLIWANFVVMIIALWVLALVLAATGVPLTAAFLAATSAISNIGPAYTSTRFPELQSIPGFNEMIPAAQYALTAGMILGRVEFLALLSLMNLAYWRT